MDPHSLILLFVGLAGAAVIAGLWLLLRSLDMGVSAILAAIRRGRRKRPPTTPGDPRK